MTSLRAHFEGVEEVSGRMLTREVHGVSFITEVAGRLAQTAAPPRHQPGREPLVEHAGCEGQACEAGRCQLHTAGCSTPICCQEGGCLAHT